MKRQIVWISFWTTMALWLGSIAGCTTSIQELFMDSQEQAGAAAAVAPAEVEPVKPLVDAQEQPASSRQDQSAVQSNPTSLLDISTMGVEPSVGEEPGIDRSKWPKIMVQSVGVGAADRPVYFKDCATHRFEPGVTEYMNQLQQLDVVLMNAHAANWSRENVKGLVTQPLRFAGDLINLPVKWVMETSKKVAGKP